MSVINSNDAIFGSIYIRDGLVLDNYNREIPGTVRFNSINKTFEGYTGELGPLGETWRELTLDIASATKLGGIKVGQNLFINDQGVLSAFATGHSRILENVITVSNLTPEPGSTFQNGDFQSINAAITYINDLIAQSYQNAPSESTPMKIIVSPGIYDEQFTLPDYVSLQGEGLATTIIRGLTGTSTFNTSPLITLGNYSTLENIEIQHYQGGANYSTCIYINNKQNINVKNIKITSGQSTPGIDVSAIYITNSNTVKLSNLDINIINGSGIINGILINNSPQIILDTCNLNITAQSNTSNGINNNLSDITIYNSNVEVSLANTNVALRNNQSSPNIYYSKFHANHTNTSQSFGILNSSTQFITTITDDITLQNNTTTPDSITLSSVSTNSFNNYNYIKISNASNPQNNNTFFLSQITSTDLFIEPNVLINETTNNVTIQQYYTIKLNSSQVIGHTFAINNLSSYCAIKENNSNFNGNITLNGGLFFGNQYKEVIVSHENGDFTNINDALNSITDNSEYNKYNIIVKPGTYNDQIVLKEYVNIIGSGKDNTIINLDASATLKSNSQIANLTIKTSSNVTTVISIIDATNFYLNDIKLIVSNDTDTELKGIYTENSSGKIYNSDITVDGLDKNTALHAYISEYIEINNSSFTTNNSLVQNNGLVFERSNGIIINSKIRLNNTVNAASNYGLLTLNSSMDEYLVQMFSSEIITPETNDYAIYTADNQTIVVATSNLVGRLYYNNTPGSNSILKLQACWAVQNIGGNMVYYTLSQSGIPISLATGNLIIGENAGNIGMTGSYNNTIVGNNSGSSIITADNSTLLGFESGYSIVDGNNNTFLGQKAGKYTTSGDSNTFTGNLSGQNNQTGSNNSAYGANSLFSNIDGNNNVAVGNNAGYNINDDDNILIGKNAAYSATTSTKNIIIGGDAGLTFTSGDNNVVIGHEAEYLATTINNVVSIGYQSGYSNSADKNVFIGSEAGHESVTALNQTIIGYQAGYSSNGDNNTIIGNQAAKSLTSGTANIAVGVKTGYSMTTGSRNILFGAESINNSLDSAGYSLTTGSDNIIVGTQAGSSLTNGNQTVLIGNQAGNSFVSPIGSVAIGYQAGASQVSQSGDIFIGYQAGKYSNNPSGNIIAIGSEAGLTSNVSTSILFGREAGKNLNGSYNIAMGFQSMKNQTSGAGSAVANVFIGHHSGLNITSGSRSVGIGGGNPTGSKGPLSSISSQSDNTAIGYLTGQNVQSAQNTLIGSQAGSNVNIGANNTMVGYNAGNSTTLGGNNIAVGSNSSFSNTSGVNNTIVGTQAGYLNNTGSSQVLIGYEAGYNSLSSGTIAIGNKAGYSNTISDNNIFIGNQAAAGSGNLIGSSNLMIGYKSGYNSTSAEKNILIGEESGYTLTTASNNVMIGDKSGYLITTGQQNTFIGSNQVGYNSTTASDNVFVGFNSGFGNTTGSRNLYLGSQAANSANTGSDNICMGNFAGFNVSDTNYNIYMGNNSGYFNTGSGNIAIGHNAASSQGSINTVNFDNVICIGYQSGLVNEASNLISIGANSSLNNTTGTGNISIGNNALSSNLIGNNNITIGENAGQSSTSSNNMYIGSNAGANNTVGNQNMYIGYGAGENNISGSNNLYLGYNAGNESTVSDFNIAIGYESSLLNNDGENNITLGYRAGRNNLTSDNVFIGNESGLLTTTGTQNLFLGNQTGKFTTTGTGNLYLGYRSGYNNITGSQNMFIGYNSGYKNTTGNNSLFFGAESGYNNTTGSNNLAIGFRAQTLNTAGEQNIAVGNYALYGNLLGNNNLVFGSNAASSGNIGDNNVILGSESARLVQNPSFTNNIIAGYGSNKQGFASSKSIIIGSNAVNIGAGGENNIIIGQNTAINLGLGSQSFSPSAPSLGGTNIVYLDNTDYIIKPGQYVTVSYDDNKVYKPQNLYTTDATETSITLSAPLTTDLTTTDKLYLLYGNFSSVIDENGGVLGNKYVIVKTPFVHFEQLFSVNQQIIIQAIETNYSQIAVITNIEIDDPIANTTKVSFDIELTNTFTIGDIIYLARLKDTRIGILDTSVASSNIIMGFNAGNALTTGSKNVAIGDSVLINITDQKYNAAIGVEAGYNVKSDNNLLLGTKAGYSIDKGLTGSGGNTIIGFAAGQFAGSSNVIESNNNLYIGNRVAQINQGSNNIFIGQENQTLQNAEAIGQTEYSNKLAIYNSDSGVPTNPLIGGDLNNNLIGIGTIDPNSTLDVQGSFAVKVSQFSQFTTTLDYMPGLTTYFDKVETNVSIYDDPIFTTFKNKGTVLIGPEFMTYSDKFFIDGATGLTGMSRGIYNTTNQHNPDGILMFDVGTIQTSDSLSIDLPPTGIVSVNSIANFASSGITSIVVIDSEIIQFTDKGKGLGGIQRGLYQTTPLSHSSGANVYMFDSINTSSPLTQAMNAGQTYMSVNSDNFLSSGNLIIDSEIIEYSDKTPYLFSVTRGTNNTTSSAHLQNSDIYLVQNTTDDLINDALSELVPSSGVSSIAINNLNDFINSGYVIINDEIISYDSIALLDITRATNGSSLPISGFYPAGTQMTLIASNINALNYTYLDQEIDENGIFDIGGNPVPPNTIILRDASGLTATGTILIDSELVTYGSITDNTLNNCVRGAYNTTAIAHPKNTKAYVINNVLFPSGIIKRLGDDDIAIKFISGHQSFPSEGTVVINGEIITYSRIALYDIVRGIENTSPSSHTLSSTVYNFSTLYYDNTTLQNNISDSSTSISLSQVGEMPVIGTILINSELITYSAGIGIINITRGIYSTTPASHLISKIVYNPVGITSVYSTLTNNITDLDSGIPVVDNTIYSNTGSLLLIDSEIMSFNDKNTLDNVIRGNAGSIAAYHTVGTPVNQISANNAVSSLAARLDITENSVILDDINDFLSPTPGNDKIIVQTLQNGQTESEIMTYSSTGNSLATFNNRGIYESGMTAHSITGIPVYQVDTTATIPLLNRIESTDLAVISSDNTVFPPTGELLVGYEIINYTNKNHSLEGQIRSFRNESQGGTSHNIGTPVYEINYTNSINTNNGLTGLSEFIATDLAIPVSITANIAGYPTSGTILVGTELINYTSKQNSLVINTTSNRGLFDSDITAHISSANVSAITIYDSITANIINSDIIGTTNGFIPLDNSTDFYNIGVVKVNRELVSYAEKDNTITTNNRGQFGTTPSSHNTGTDVFNISILASTTALNNISNTETQFIVLDDTNDFKDNGNALIYNTTNNDYEIITYAYKNNTLINVQRGLDQSSGNTYLTGDNFQGIIESNDNVELLSNITNSTVYLPIKSYSGLTTQLISDGGYLALNNELISYASNGQDFNNVNRDPVGYGSNSFIQSTAVNKIRNYDDDIPLHNLATINSNPASNPTFPYSIGDKTVTRGFNSTINVSHNNQLIRIISDNTNNLTTKILNSGMNSIQTIVNLNNTTGLAPSGYLIIDAEIMSYTVNINLLNVTRAVNDTTATTHTAGKIVYFMPGAVIATLNQYSALNSSSTAKIPFTIDNPTLNGQLSVPPNGIALIESELIAYTSYDTTIGDFTTTQDVYQNYVLTISRGTNSTSSSVHSSNTKAVHIKEDTTDLSYSTLTSDISATASNIPITDLTSFTTPGYALIDNEIIYYTGTTTAPSNLLTDCVRNYGYITGATSHLSNSNTTKIYKTDKPYEFYVSSIATTGITTCNIWASYIPLNILGNQGTFIIDNEIIKYTNVDTTYTNKLLDCQRNINYSGYYYPSASLLAAGTGITGEYTISGANYGNGEYTFNASSITADYYPSLAFSNYDIKTTLTSTFSDIATTINVSSTTNFPSTGSVIIDTELISYTSKTSNTFTGLTRSSPVNHTNGSSVYNNDYSNVGWRSNEGYDVLTGAYTGSNSTIVDGITHYGEWIDIYNPNLLLPSSVYITTNESIIVTLAGSVNGSSWSLLKNNQTLTSGVNNVLISTSNYYNYIKCIIESKGTTGTSYAQINQLKTYSYLSYEINVTYITNQTDLQGISSNLSGNYLLSNNITIVGALTTNSGIFTGKFNGNGNTITITSTTNGGIFGINDGYITNVNVVITSDSNVYNSGSIANSNYTNGIIEYCNVERNVPTPGISNGGLVGLNYGTIRYCNAILTVVNYALQDDIGGLIGTNYNGTITNCSTSGDIKGRHNSGGLVGFFRRGTISKCSSSANVKAISDNVISGFIGAIDCDVAGITISISDCYASGDVDGRAASGGMFGYTKLNFTNNYLNVSNCYFSGKVYNNFNEIRISVFIGFTWDTNYNEVLNQYTFTNCYCDTQKSHPYDQKTNTYLYNSPSYTYYFPGIYGKTTTEMQTLATYQNWDFTTIWNYTTYPSYPFLRPFTPCPSFPYPFILNSTSAFSYNKFTQTYQLNSNTIYESLLSKLHSSTDTNINVFDASLFYTSGYLLINNEIIKYSGKSGNTLTGITRGNNVSSHNSFTKVLSLSNYPSAELYIEQIGESETSIFFEIGVKANQGISAGSFCIVGSNFNEIITSNSVVGYNQNTYYNNTSFGLSYAPGNIQEIIGATTTIITSPDINTSSGGITSRYYAIGNSLITTNDCDIINNSITVSVLYESITGLPSTITISSSSLINTFNPHGGYVLLYNIDAFSLLTESILVSYTGISSNDLTGTQLVGQVPVYLENVPFTSLLYLKWNNTLEYPINNLLYVGINDITVNKDLLPLNTTLLGIRDTGYQFDLIKCSGTMSYKSVNRYQRNTTPTTNTITNLVLVDEEQSGILKSTILSTDTSIPTITSDDFGSQGYCLVGSDYFTFTNGSGITALARGALNTSATSHNLGTSYYQYKLTDPTTLRYNITNSQDTISIQSNSGLTGLSNYLLSSSSVTNKNYEIVSSNYWNNSLDDITRSVTAITFNSIDNIIVYGLTAITSSPLRSDITLTDNYVPITNGVQFEQNFGSGFGNYILIDTEFMSLNARYSLDKLTRNYFGSATAIDQSSLVQTSTPSNYSTLRQNISSNHIFMPLNNASNYTSPGYVLINQEWFYYTNKNSFDFTLPNRGRYNTVISNYEYNQNTPILYVSGITDHNRQLRSNINETTNTIPLDNSNTAYSANNIVLINSEFIKTGSKYSFDFTLPNRGQYNTNLFTTGITTGYTVSSVSLNPYSILRDPIGATTEFIPVVDGSGYSNSGIALIDSEFVDWANKNSLDGLTRGLDGTTFNNHEINTGINIVARLADFNTDINGNIILNSVPIKGDKIFLSDDISGIKVSDTLDFQYISNSGTILIDSEQISYASKDTLANIIRGTSSTLPATHQNGSTVFLLPSTPIVTNTLTNDITVNSTEIKCDNVITSAPPGYILIDSEIIKYETISLSSLILTNITRGSFNTTIATHSTGSTVYFIPTPVASSLISQSNPMSETDMIVSLVSNANFTSSGTILIDSEIMTYTSKNALGDLVRGVNSTNPQGYPNNTPLELLNITLTVKDSSIIVDTSANNMTIDLPDAINIKGRIYTVKKLVSANTVSINPYGTQTIDDALNYNLLLTNAFISFQSDGANWKIISNSNFDALGAAVDALTTANNYTDQEINTVKYRTIEEVSQDVSITNPVTTTESVCIINTYPTTFNINQVLSFTVNNVNIVAGDLIFTQVITPDTDDVPFISIRNITTGSFVMSMRNITGGVIPITSQKISFQIIKKA